MNRLYAMIIICIGIPTIDASCRNFHRNTWASYLEYGGRHDKAQRWYEQILQAGGSWHNFKGYINVLEKKKRYHEIVHLIDKKITLTTPQESTKTLDELFEHDPDVQSIFAQALLHVGKISESQDRFIRLSAEFKKSPDITLHAIEAHMHRNEPEKALAVIERFLNNNPKKPTHFVFYFLKAQLYTQLHQYQDALTWIKESVKPNPHFAQAWLLKAIIEEQLGLTDDAIVSYHQFLKTSGIYNSEILRHLMDLEKQKKQSKLMNTKPLVTMLYTVLSDNNQFALLAKLDTYLEQLSLHKNYSIITTSDQSLLNKSHRLARRIAK